MDYSTNEIIFMCQLVGTLGLVAFALTIIEKVFKAVGVEGWD